MPDKKLEDDQSANGGARGAPSWTELSDPLKSVRMLAAFLIVLIYIGIVVWLIVRLGAVELAGGEEGKYFSDKGWEQITYLLAAIGALATTAAGVVIGVQVQQVSVASANRRAELSETEALDAKAKKEKAQTAAANALKQMDAMTDPGSFAAEAPAAAPGPEAMRAIRTELQEALKP